MSPRISAPRFLDSLGEAVQEHPVAAGLVGLGVAWALLGAARASGAGARLVRAAHDMEDLVHDAGVEVIDAATAGYGAVTTQAEASLHRGLSAILEREPLALGAIGLAIGAGIASAFPSTSMEHDLMGGTVEDVKGKVQAYASNAAELGATMARHLIDDREKQDG